MRLFCFPYAGGGAAIYRGWADELPAEIEVCPVQLPGREARLTESAYTHMQPLVEALADALAPQMQEKPFAFFGHSMGAAVAFELCHYLRQTGRQVPIHLLLSARRAPQRPPRKEDKEIYSLPDEEFMQELRELDGTPEQVLEHPELMQLMLPLLRADFELNDTYELDLERPLLETPIGAYGGLEDKEVDRDDLQAWSELSKGSFKLRMFPGNHFFLNDLRTQLVRAVAGDLIRLLNYR